MNDYYVYVYIDPRNYEDFYYGKGQGSRKYDHLKDTSHKRKAKRIAEIKRETGSDPIIRVIARGLKEQDALLIEKTLLWKLGKWTDNEATGYFADEFRPPNTLHRKLSGFDYMKGIYYYNVGETSSNRRNWDDYVQFGFISAGHGRSARIAIERFNPGDIFVAYLSKRGKRPYGFVGIGKIKQKAKMIRDIKIKGKPLLSLPLQAQNMGDDNGSIEMSEYVCLVDWIKTFPRDKAKRSSSKNLFRNPNVQASLDNHQETIDFVQDEFGVKNLRDLAK